MAQAIPHAPLAGPATGAPKWIPQLGNFLSAEPRVAVATLHRYPLKHCSKAAHVTIGQLLAEQLLRRASRTASRGTPGSPTPITSRCGSTR